MDPSSSRQQRSRKAASADLTLPSDLMDPVALLRSRSYVMLLVFGAVIGVPIAAVAYFFLKFVALSQHWVLDTLPLDLGFSSVPAWWVLPVLALAGLIVGATIHYLPGTGGHEPADGFKSDGAPSADMLPGIVIASFITLSSGVVLGPEAPLIAIGSGLAVLVVHLVKKDAPAQASVVIGAAGSFAAVSTLLGSPILGAFLLMEMAGLGGPLLGVVLVPGLLAAGVGALIFVGLDNITGFGTFSLAIPDIPTFSNLDGWQFAWAIGIGLLAAVVGTAIRRGAKYLQPLVAPRRVLLTPLIGVGIALAVIVFAQTYPQHGDGFVLFSGQDSMASLIDNAAKWSVGALVLLMACKGVAYVLSLSSFRGGPTFPAMFIGAAGGMALSHVGHLPLIAGVAMGTGAMTVTMLGMPLTSVLLTAVFLQADSVTLMPLIIVAVVVAYVAAAHLGPAPPDPPEPEPAPTATSATSGAPPGPTGADPPPP